MATKKRRAKVGKKSRPRNTKRLKKVAENLAKGMNKTEACINAGYSPITADKKGYQIVKYPFVQSYLNDVLQEVLAERNKNVKAIIIPFVDALDANIISRTPLGAFETTLPDHVVRMMAAKHLKEFMEPKQADVDSVPDADKKPPVMLNIQFVNAPAGSLAERPTTIVNPAAPSLPPPQAPRVEFVHSSKR